MVPRPLRSFALPDAGAHVFPEDAMLGSMVLASRDNSAHALARGSLATALTLKER
jgi:hypothetical protein